MALSLFHSYLGYLIWSFFEYITRKWKWNREWTHTEYLLCALHACIEHCHCAFLLTKWNKKKKWRKNKCKMTRHWYNDHFIVEDEKQELQPARAKRDERRKREWSDEKEKEKRERNSQCHIHAVHVAQLSSCHVWNLFIHLNTSSSLSLSLSLRQTLLNQIL